MQASKIWVGQGLLCSILFSLGQVAWSTTAKGSSVLVSKTGFVEVILEKPASLRTVLDDLCAATHTDCEGTQLASDSMVAPLTISGGWTQVVEILLDGTGLNYIAIPPGQGQKGSLWIRAASNPVTGDQRCPDAPPFRQHVSATDIPSGGDNKDCGAVQSESNETTSVSVSSVELSTGSLDSTDGLQGSGSQASENQVAPQSGSPFPEAGTAPPSGSQNQRQGPPFPESLVQPQ